MIDVNLCLSALSCSKLSSLRCIRDFLDFHILVIFWNLYRQFTLMHGRFVQFPELFPFLTDMAGSHLCDERKFFLGHFSFLFRPVSFVLGRAII